MTDYTALQAAITDLAAKQQAIATNIVANDAAIQEAVTNLKAAIVANDQPTVDALTAKITELSASCVTEAQSIATETASLTAALPASAAAPTTAQPAAPPAATG